jgi:hypothetical protein
MVEISSWDLFLGIAGFLSLVLNVWLLVERWRLSADLLYLLRHIWYDCWQITDFSGKFKDGIAKTDQQKESEIAIEDQDTFYEVATGKGLAIHALSLSARDSINHYMREKLGRKPVKEHPGEPKDSKTPKLKKGKQWWQFIKRKTDAGT